jgi:hypothetical protein
VFKVAKFDRILVAPFEAWTELQHLAGAAVDAREDVVVVDREQGHRWDELHSRLRGRAGGKEKSTDAHERDRRRLSSRHGSAEVQ